VDERASEGRAPPWIPQLVNQEFPKYSYFDLASIIVTALPNAFAGGMRTEFVKCSKQCIAICPSSRPKEVESLLVEHILPIGHSLALGEKSLMRGQYVFLAHLAPRIHALHRRVDLLAHLRCVEVIEDLEIFCHGQPFGATHRL